MLSVTMAHLVRVSLVVHGGPQGALVVRGTPQAAGAEAPAGHAHSPADPPLRHNVLAAGFPRHDLGLTWRPLSSRCSLAGLGLLSDVQLHPNIEDHLQSSGNIICLIKDTSLRLTHQCLAGVLQEYVKLSAAHYLPLSEVQLSSAKHASTLPTQANSGKSMLKKTKLRTSFKALRPISVTAPQITSSLLMQNLNVEADCPPCHGHPGLARHGGGSRRASRHACS